MFVSKTVSVTLDYTIAVYRQEHSSHTSGDTRINWRACGNADFKSQSSGMLIPILGPPLLLVRRWYLRRLWSRIFTLTGIFIQAVLLIVLHVPGRNVGFQPTMRALDSRELQHVFPDLPTIL